MTDRHDRLELDDPDPADPRGSQPYPLRRAFLMLSLPFALLAVFTAGLLWWLGEKGDGATIAPAQRIERRMEGIRATAQEDASKLIEARNSAPDTWTEAQVAAFRGLVERTGWPTELGESTVVTRSRLIEATPAEWNEAERTSAAALLDHFERYWFSQPRKLR